MPSSAPPFRVQAQTLGKIFLRNYQLMAGFSENTKGNFWHHLIFFDSGNAQA